MAPTSSSELSDARYLGGLEQRVTSLESGFKDLGRKLDQNHVENVSRLDKIQGSMDRQDGGIKMLRLLGTGFIAVPGWVLWAIQIWRKH